MIKLEFLKVFSPMIGRSEGDEMLERPACTDVTVQASLIVAGAGVGGNGRLKLTFFVPGSPGELPLSSLERSADEAAADILEAIASELRKRVAE